jgi:PAS domain S-box-containing protein
MNEKNKKMTPQERHDGTKLHPPPPEKLEPAHALLRWGKEVAAMHRTRLQARFLLWGVAFAVAGGLAGAMVHGVVMNAGWGFPWDYLVTIPVLFAFWAVPFWVALRRWVLRPVERIVEANRKVAAGDEANSFFAPEAVPDDEIGDIMRSRNEMLARLREAHAEVYEQARHLGQLYDAGRELLCLSGQPLTEEEVLHRAVGSLCHLAQAKYGAVGFVDDEGRLLQFVHSGLTEEEVARIGPPPQGVGLLGALIKEGKVIRLEDLTKDPRHTGFPPHHPPMKTLLAVPIAGQDKVYGCLYLTEKEGGRAFTEEDASLALSFASSLALGLDNLRLQERTREAEARYRDLYEHAPDGLDEVNAEGLITSMNQTLLDWLGYSREEVVGKMRYEELLTEEGRRQLPLAEERCRREGRVENVEWELVRKDGRRLPVRINAVAVYGPDGAVMGCRATTRDVTREKELERQFLQAQKMEALGTLAGGVAHDFNNILAVIMMQADLAGLVENVPQQLQRSLQDIKVAAERAAGLTRQLLLFSRHQVMQPRRLDLNAVVTNLAKMLRRILGEDVRLELNLYPAPVIVHADAGMLDQVLMNLAVNARDAMPKGGRLLIETAEKVPDAEQARLNPEASPGRHVCLSVSDTGGGIPPEILPRIFEPFFTTKAPGKGTGLGLATVFGIVKQHQGWIEVQSEPRQGATFQIFLPASEAGAEEPAQEEAKAKPRGGSETILLVEDDAAVRTVTRLLLARHGYRVLEAASGVEALEIWRAQEGRIDLLLTDLVMPEGVDGRELAAQLRTQQPGLKVIFTSGYSPGLAGRELTLQAGQSFLPKPCPPQQLLETVRTRLDR